MIMINTGQKKNVNKEKTYKQLRDIRDQWHLVMLEAKMKKIKNKIQTESEHKVIYFREQN